MNRYEDRQSPNPFPSPLRSSQFFCSNAFIQLLFSLDREERFQSLTLPPPPLPGSKSFKLKALRKRADEFSEFFLGGGKYTIKTNGTTEESSHINNPRTVNHCRTTSRYLTSIRWTVTEKKKLKLYKNVRVKLTVITALVWIPSMD